jgi:hypothetical protein
MRFSAGISTPNNRGIIFVKKVTKLQRKFASLHYPRPYPCRCLCRGFLQMTRTTFLRFTILQDSQSLLTDGRTFIFPRDEKIKEKYPRVYLWRNVIRPFDKS